MILTIVAGARPNFMKIAPLIRAIEKASASGKNISYRLVHTGQHYDDAMSRSFFRDLHIPEPHINLNAGSGSQAEQTAAIMIAFEKELLAHKPTAVVVVGDVNSTLACSVVAKKMWIQVVHVEAGIRSFDLTMPEEINRMVTDSISDHFFTTTPEAGENLTRAGITDDRIHFVGNTMIDTLIANLDRLIRPSIVEQYKIQKGQYLIITLHRPSNVDDPEKLSRILSAIASTSDNLPVIFPVHPRTRATLQRSSAPTSIILVEPMRYLEFMYMVRNAMGVITDSGGIQEETTFLKVPCITLRENTERPETVKLGTNLLIGSDPEKIRGAMEMLLTGRWKTGKIPARWDGLTAERIVDTLYKIYEQKIKD